MKKRSIRRVFVRDRVAKPGNMDSGVDCFDTKHYAIAPTTDSVLGQGVIVSAKSDGEKRESFIPMANIRSIETSTED